ncbi:MAG: ribonuclease III [Gammaproteobacteria bacterium]
MLNYEFAEKSLLEIALTHRSAGNPNNERLEFLGDAILGAIIADELHHRFPTGNEGQMTRLRSSLVKKRTLAKLGRDLELGSYLKLGEGEMKTGGWRRASILENTVEAIIGAVFLDSGFDRCRLFVKNIFKELLESITLEDIQKDPKTTLQELLQSHKKPIPVYEVLSSTGKSHEQVFTVSCACELLPAIVQAQGASRRKAEQAAAQLALDFIQEKSEDS